jgi:multidrug resistance protein MdtO
MAPPADDGRRSLFAGLREQLAARPGRLEFAVRLAVLCALVALDVEIFKTPDPALTVYVAFFVIKPDRATSVLLSVVFLLVITVVVGITMLAAMAVVDQPLWRVTAMALMSFFLLFLGSASKLKPFASIVALITAYALDLLGNIQIGELATRALLYAWLFVAIPALISIAVNLVMGPAPRRLAERAMAHRLRLCAARLRGGEAKTRHAFEVCREEGMGEILAHLKLAGLEKTSPKPDLAALGQAARSLAVLLPLTELIAEDPDAACPEPLRSQVAGQLDEMAAILLAGGYPVEVEFPAVAPELALSPLATAVAQELGGTLTGFATPAPAPSGPAQPPAAKAKGGFFVPDAFTNPAHVHYALKTTAAAMFCYVVYSLLDWPGIHTCLITCYIVSLGTMAETIEKLALRIAGCLVGAAVGMLAIVFLMPGVTSIGVLMAIVFVGALASGWVAAGGPRISYAGFQLAFAFFLCVIQGDAPAFKLTTARDRVVGILFGDLTVAVLFAQLWPVSIARRIDPAIAAVLHKGAALAAAASRATRAGAVIQAEMAGAALRQDLRLARYEPPSLRPAGDWLALRIHAARQLAALEAPLLLAADRSEGGDPARRLERLAGALDVSGQPQPISAEAGAPAAGSDELAASAAVRGLVEARLAQLEQAVARLAVESPVAAGRDAYAPA